MPLLQHRVDVSRPVNRTIWTANHPPLYYLVAAVPLRLGVELGYPVGGIRAARLVNVAISLLGLILIVLLARELVPARPELWVGAAALAALVPGFVQTSAIVYNDALMFTLTTGTLLLIARVLRRGPTAWRLGLLAVLAAAAALTRSTGLIVVAMAALAVVVAVARDAGRPARTRILLATAAGGAIVLTAVATAGWFYLRNRQIYGSTTGTGALLRKFSRSRRGTVPQMLVEPDFWRSQLRRLWDDSAGPSARTRLRSGGTSPSSRSSALPSPGCAGCAGRCHPGPRWRSPGSPASAWPGWSSSARCRSTAWAAMPTAVTRCPRCPCSPSPPRPGLSPCRVSGRCRSSPRCRCCSSST